MTSLTSSAQAQETGTLRMTFKLKGTAESLPPLSPTVDQAFCGLKKIPNESLVVNPENNGIQNVIVFVKTGRGGTDLPEMDLKAETHVLANKDCRFEPHVVIAKTGDTIKVTNPDKVGHNANFSFLVNDPVNQTIPPGQFIEVELEKSEPVPVGVACNIHPWMKARLAVFDHPFAAVSDENGVLEIKGLPVGGEIVFRASPEPGKLTSVVIDGKETEWRRSYFEVDIKKGMNDLGVIEIPASAFSE
jgi:plastocyanin